MEIGWLEDFLTLANTLNFSRAAELRNMTQPAFSRRIKGLELWLGTTLIDRSTFPATLTPQGVEFRHLAEDMVQKLNQSRQQLQGQPRKNHYSFSVATLHSIAVSLFPSWLKKASMELGPVSATLLTANLYDCVQTLMAGSCDFLMCYAHASGTPLLDPKQYTYMIVGEDQLIPVSAPDLAGRPLYDVGNARLLGQPVPLLSYATESFLGRMVNVILARQETLPDFDIRCESCLADALKAMAIEGIGVAWLPESSVREPLQSGQLVRAGDTSWSLEMDIRLYFAKGRHSDIIKKISPNATLIRPWDGRPEVATSIKPTGAEWADVN